MTATRLRSFTVEGPILELFVSDCAACGVVFGIPKDLERRRRDDHGSFYCPNGHSMVFSGKNEAEQERERAERAEQRLKWAEAREQAQRREREAAERQARTYKGHVTRLRNRIAAGICPVQSCRRNFANVKAHIESQHPDWAHDHPDALS